MLCSSLTLAFFKTSLPLSFTSFLITNLSLTQLTFIEVSVEGFDLYDNIIDLSLQGYTK